jgi:phospholipid-binding lipoprotein MlaA
MLKTVTGHTPLRLILAALLTGALAACSTPPDEPEARAEYEEANDPFETANRLVFSANVMVDQMALQPMAVTYRDLFPDNLKPPVQNFITNLFQPISFIHALLQGDMERAEKAAARFFTSLPTLMLGNTMPHEEPVFEDAGQTLAVWGFEEGPYVMLPLLGPSSVRDTTGTVADFFLDPLGWVLGTEATVGRTVGNAVVVRSRNLDQVRELQRTSLDYYAAVRSLYRQQRDDQIQNGESERMQPAPTIGLELEDLQNKETASGN